MSTLLLIIYNFQQLVKSLRPQGYRTGGSMILFLCQCDDKLSGILLQVIKPIPGQLSIRAILEPRIVSYPITF